MGSMPSLNDILYRAGRIAGRGVTLGGDIARRATTIGGDPEAVASVRAGEDLMASEDAGRAMGQNAANRNPLQRALEAMSAGYGGTDAPPEGDIDLSEGREPPVSRSAIDAHALRIGAPPPPSPINRAAMRASDRRAQMLDPGMATGIKDIPMEPTSMGVFVSPRQREENRGVAARGAFQASPEWKGVGGGLRSRAQMEQDLYAHDLLDAGAGQANADIARQEAVRGNPMQRAIAARKNALEYEDLLPATADSHLRVGNGGDMLDFEGQAPPLGTPTMGEYRQNRSLIAQAAAKQNPKDVAEGQATAGRLDIAGELAMLRQQLQADVRAGKVKPADAEARWQKATSQAQILAEILKPGFPQRPDPLAGALGQ